MSLFVCVFVCVCVFDAVPVFGCFVCSCFVVVELCVLLLRTLRVSFFFCFRMLRVILCKVVVLVGVSRCVCSVRCACVIVVCDCVYVVCL